MSINAVFGAFGACAIRPPSTRTAHFTGLGFKDFNQYFPQFPKTGGYQMLVDGEWVYQVPVDSGSGNPRIARGTFIKAGDYYFEAVQDIGDLAFDCDPFSTLHANHDWWRPCTPVADSLLTLRYVLFNYPDGKEDFEPGEWCWQEPTGSEWDNLRDTGYLPAKMVYDSKWKSAFYIYKKCNRPIPPHQCVGHAWRVYLPLFTKGSNQLWEPRPPDTFIEKTWTFYPPARLVPSYGTPNTSGVAGINGGDFVNDFHANGGWFVALRSAGVAEFADGCALHPELFSRLEPAAGPSMQPNTDAFHCPAHTSLQLTTRISCGKAIVSKKTFPPGVPNGSETRRTWIGMVGSFTSRVKVNHYDVDGNYVDFYYINYPVDGWDAACNVTMPGVMKPTLSGPEYEAQISAAIDQQISRLIGGGTSGISEFINGKFNKDNLSADSSSWLTGWSKPEEWDNRYVYPLSITGSRMIFNISSVITINQRPLPGAQDGPWHLIGVNITGQTVTATAQQLVELGKVIFAVTVSDSGYRDEYTATRNDRYGEGGGIVFDIILDSPYPTGTYYEGANGDYEMYMDSVHWDFYLFGKLQLEGTYSLGGDCRAEVQSIVEADLAKQPVVPGGKGQRKAKYTQSGTGWNVQLIPFPTQSESENWMITSNRDTFEVAAFGLLYTKTTF